ncbi:MAG TPA: ABC transporter ATP-binding protein [Bacillales bacterium]|nr:ABC transporter ATP-binding protein [Bacillales bacterium]
MTLLNLIGGVKRYQQGTETVRALDEVSLKVERGEIIVILGASGSGKTTLLNILAGLDSLDHGEYLFDGTSVDSMDKNQLTELRKMHFGFIFQTYNLLDNLNVTQNVKVGAMLNDSIQETDVHEMIRLVGLEDKRDSSVLELSGGQQQRVAIARALAKKPDVLFCDEPTGALDEHTSKEILKLMIGLNEKLQTTMIIVTHNPIIANIADHVIIMRDGKIESKRENKRQEILNLDWSL